MSTSVRATPEGELPHTARSCTQTISRCPQDEFMLAAELSADGAGGGAGGRGDPAGGTGGRWAESSGARL